MNNDIRKYVKGDVGGLGVYLDRYIILDNDIVYVSSFAGSETVRGFNAGIVADWSVKIDGYMYRRAKLTCKMLSHKITAAITHGIVYVEDYFDVTKIINIAIVTSDTEEEASDKIFELIKNRTAVPLLDVWKKDLISNTCKIRELESFGFNIVREVILPHDEVIQKYVLANLSSLKKLI